ncbi:MAG: amino acid transporter [Halobacteriovoraceae bacterium]|jgi:hypothetical protein|nr:amino acid transporter [Halobacteriovoraceae bacterium]
MEYLSKEEESRPWTPMQPSEVYSILKEVKAPWWIAGGWAIEFFVGENYRTHSGLDLLILREDQLKFQNAFSDWEIFASDPPGQLRLWNKDETLPQISHDIWLRKDSSSNWALQFMLMDSIDDSCLFRRDNSISLPRDEISMKTEDNLPFLCPHFQLLYNSKSLRDKDLLDFQKSLPLLNQEQKIWLLEKLKYVYNNNHPWINELVK